MVRQNPKKTRMLSCASESIISQFLPSAGAHDKKSIIGEDGDENR